MYLQGLHFIVMKLSTWRTNVREWFSSSVHVDSWELSTPIVPGTTVGYIEPLRDIVYDYRGQLEGRASQHIYLLCRYPANLKYHQLPLNELEGLHSTVSQLLLQDWLAFDIEDLEYSMLDQPIKVMETGDNLGEWVIELHWLARFTWTPELETTNNDLGIGLYRVNFNLYREALDNSGIVLDTELDVLSTPLTNNTDTLTSNTDVLTNDL